MMRLAMYLITGAGVGALILVLILKLLSVDPAVRAIAAAFGCLYGGVLGKAFFDYGERKISRQHSR